MKERVPSNYNRDKCYNAGKLRTPIIRKTIIYECGCEVILDGWNRKEANHCCPKHLTQIKKIITETTYY